MQTGLFSCVSGAMLIVFMSHSAGSCH